MRMDRPLLFCVLCWSSDRLQLRRCCSHVMVPKGFLSVMGEQDHDTSFSLSLPSPCVGSAGSMACNPRSLAIPWETASTEVRDG